MALEIASRARSSSDAKAPPRSSALPTPPPGGWPRRCDGLDRLRSLCHAVPLSGVELALQLRKLVLFLIVSVHGDRMLQLGELVDQLLRIDVELFEPRKQLFGVALF